LWLSGFDPQHQSWLRVGRGRGEGPLSSPSAPGGRDHLRWVGPAGSSFSPPSTPRQAEAGDIPGCLRVCLPAISQSDPERLGHQPGQAGPVTGAGEAGPGGTEGQKVAGRTHELQGNRAGGTWRVTSRTGLSHFLQEYDLGLPGLCWAGAEQTPQPWLTLRLEAGLRLCHILWLCDLGQVTSPL
jgi:hypothetical protein